MLTALQSFVQSFASFSWALAVFGFSQSGNVFKGLPTRTPTAGATANFVDVTAAIQAKFDSIDNAIYNPVNTVQTSLIALAFGFLQPSNFNPTTIAQTSWNLVRWSWGIAAQLIPGGVVGSGGPPVGWGPVNRADAELFSTTGPTA